MGNSKQYKKEKFCIFNRSLRRELNEFRLERKTTVLTWFRSLHIGVPLLPPANVVCEGYVFTPVCDSVNRGRGGMRGCLGGGVHGCSGGGLCGCSREGACMVGRGGCMVALGGHAWLLVGGGHAWLLPGGVCGCSGGRAWFLGGGAVNERALRILLECILVWLIYYEVTVQLKNLVSCCINILFIFH